MAFRLRKLGGIDTGFPASDAQTDFSRARREQALARLTSRLRREPSDFDVILPFEEVVAALGWVGQRSLGLQSIPLDSIVGTVDRSKEFDREFRPTSGRVRGRWQRIAEAQRRGRDMPPISVYRVGDLHFVQRRPPPRVGRAGSGPHAHRRIRDRGRDPGPDRLAAAARGPAAEGTRAPVQRAGAAERRGARARAALGPVGLRLPGGGRRGLGHARDSGPRRVHDARGGRRGLVPRGLPAGRQARCARPAARRPERDRRLHARGVRPLPADAHARVEREDPHRAAAEAATSATRRGSGS